MNHRRGYKDADEAMSSKAYLSNPGATVSHCRPCGLVHVDLPKPKPASLPKARRDTGPSAAVRRLVRERERDRCAACGVSVTGRDYSVQHRVARGMGGTPDPAANAMSNLVLLCGSATTPGSCHLACERRDREMHARGFWLNSWESAAEIPVMLASRHGSGITVWLTDSGEYSTEPPAKAVALWPR